tara:strand:- start:55 stop:285 length:231 start_codon:yes stop_codon:yes gene_type:complete
MKKNEIEDILIKIKPETKKFIKRNVNFVDDALLDSFDIMRFLVEIQQKKKKKINFGKISRDSFYNLENIKKLIDKI